MSQKGESMEGNLAVFSRLETIKKRPEFLRASTGKRASMPGLNLQGYFRGDGFAPRVGFTATKKVGNAVVRNRAKRRMRELAQNQLRQHARAGWDYVLVARANLTISRSMDALANDLVEAVSKIHKS